MTTRWIALAAVGLAAPPAAAQCFNVDLGIAGGTPSASYEGAAGQPGVWNGIDVVADQLIPLVDLGGNATKTRFEITQTPSSTGLSGSAGGGPTGEHAALYNDFVNDAFMVLTFERLDAGDYLVYTYGWSTEAGGGNRVLVDVVSGLHSGDFLGDSPWPGDHAVNDTYVTDFVTVDATGRLRVVICNYLGPGRPSGFQLVKIGACPPAATPYCDQGAVEQCDPVTRVSGRPSVTLNQRFQVETVGARNVRDGLYFFTTNGRQSDPWANAGTLCLTPPLVRTPRLTTGPFEPQGLCNGQLSFDFNAWMAAHPRTSPPAGATVQMQAWSYDPQNASSGPRLFDAIEFTLEP